MPQRMTAQQTVMMDAATGPQVVVRVAGEVDFETTDVLRTALTRALAVDAVRQVIVDLDAVSYLDSTGIAALMAAHHRAAAQQATVIVINTHGIVQRVLTLSGVLPTLTEPVAGA
jgi:anti-anti-sigma factor